MGEEAIEADVGDGIQETQAGARGVARCAHIQLRPVANLLDLGENQFNLIFPLVTAKVVFKVARPTYAQVADSAIATGDRGAGVPR
jgi:hypothetical protein